MLFSCLLSCRFTTAGCNTFSEFREFSPKSLHSLHGGGTVKMKKQQSQQIWLLFSSGTSGVSGSRWVLKWFNNGSKLPYFSSVFFLKLISFMGGVSMWHVEPISFKHTIISTPLTLEQQRMSPDDYVICFCYYIEHTKVKMGALCQSGKPHSKKVPSSILRLCEASLCGFHVFTVSGCVLSWYTDFPFLMCIYSQK